VPAAIFLLLLFFLPDSLSGQNRYVQNNVDSAAIKKRIDSEYARRDSILAAAKQRRIDDSMARVVQKKKMQDYRDSLVNARKAKRIADSVARVEAKLKLLNDQRIADSLETARRNRYKDSLAVENQKLETARKEKRRIDDSLAMENKRVQDSIALVKKHYNDSISAIREADLKARAELAKYRNSKAYKDSVEARRQFVKDSMKAKQQEQLNLVKADRQRINDSLRDARQKYNDSVNTARKNYNDSVLTAQKNLLEKNKAERERINDSLLAAREKRMDSLAALRKKNQKEGAEKKEKTNAEKQKALAIKVHDKKKEEWSNEKLLKRKWSLPRRIYQNTVTRYNYYYNAKRKYDESIRTMTKAYKEDYEQPLSLDPYDIRKQGSSVASFMDTVIKKASFSTQIHDPRSKWFDNLYFLMGRASYVKNDFDGAITTFQFIANEYMDPVKKNKDSKADPKSKDDVSIATLENRKGIRRLRHHPIRNDALIWLAKSYMMAEQYSEAQSLLGTLAKDRNFPERKKADLFLTKAALDIEQGNRGEAIESLEQALKKDLPDRKRTRMEFLLGQLYAEKAQYAKSTEHFKKSVSKKASPEMDFFTKLKIAENAALGGGDQAYAVAQLEKIIADPKYAKYKSQALNTLAEIERNTNTLAAIGHLQKSIANPENKDTKQKAIAFAKLGDIYYSLSNYESAKVAYDSAAILGVNPPIDNLKDVQVRKEVLGEIVKNIRIIRNQDSMLLLAKKGDKEQKAAAKRELDRIKAEKEKQQPDAGTSQPVALQPNNNKSNWYFYNNTLIQKGSQEFKQKWGNRKLEDNWRRMSAINGSFATGGQGEEKENEAEEGAEGAGDGASMASLLAKLPKTPADVDKANNAIMDAYYSLGLTYFSKLEDYLHSIDMFDTLLYRFPNSNYRKQCFYGLYIDYEKLGNSNKSAYYKKMLNDEFPQTDFALRANNPNYIAEQKSLLSNVFDHYDQTYQLYREGKYREAIDRSTFAYSNYKANPILAKYQLVEAISYAGMKDFSQSKTVLEKLIQTYPNTAEQQRAQDILALLSAEAKGDSLGAKQGDPLFMNTGNSLYQDSLEASEAFKDLRAADGKGAYFYDVKEEHKVLVFVKNVDGRTMGLKSALSDYNLLRHNVKEYQTGLNLLTAQQAVLSVEKFANAVFARQYATEMASEKLLFSQLKKHEFEIGIISISNFTELMKTRDILGYMRFYRKNYK